jgi:hypothetical protein
MITKEEVMCESKHKVVHIVLKDGTVIDRDIWPGLDVVGDQASQKSVDLEPFLAEYDGQFETMEIEEGWLSMFPEYTKITASIGNVSEVVCIEKNIEEHEAVL